MDRDALPAPRPSAADGSPNAIAPSVGHWLFVAAFLLVCLVYIAGPIQAIRWSRKPFPGFLVERTGLVTDYRGQGWGFPVTGLRHPQRVVEVAGRPISVVADYHAAVSGLVPDGAFNVTAVLPDGTATHRVLVALPRFPRADLARLFWLPFGIGLVYFALGLWVYTVRRDTSAGRAFAVYCIVTALVLGLIFDLVSGHFASHLWTVAMALEGSVLMALALHCPHPARPLQLHRWIGYAPFALSLVLAAWGVRALEDTSLPWAYVTAWRASYAYTAAAIVFFVGRMASLAFGAREDRVTGVAVLATGEAVAQSAEAVRRQTRVVLLGSFTAFAPIAVWFVGPLIGVRLPFNAPIYLPSLLLFPLSIAIAIVRYHLWDIDLIINRALVYGILTVILGSIYAGGVLGLEALLASQLASASSLAVAVSTLAIAALFGPLRKRVQRFIDRKFYRQKYNAAQTLAAFGDTLREELELSHIAERLMACVQEALQPAHLELWLSTPAGYCLTAGEPPCPEEDVEVAPGVRENGAAGRAPGDSAPSVQESVSDNTTYAHAADLIPPEARLPSELRAVGEPIAPTRLAALAGELQSLKDRDIHLLVPLISHGELVGWLGLGPRRSEQPFSYDDRALLRDLALRAGPAIRVAQLVRVRQREARERERLAHEMRFARLVQQTLLPSTTPHLPNWQLSVHWQPARAVGGDFYDLMKLPDGRLAIVIADVADKGIPAALVMATTRPILRGAARWGKPPSEALARANELLVSELPAGMFVTCLYAILDPGTGQLQYANAGHNPPLLRQPTGIHELWATGMALGLLPDSQYDEYETYIEPGDTLLFYSDGLTEAHDEAGEMYGLQRIQSAFETHGTSAQRLLAGLLVDLRRFTANRRAPEDDVTMLALSYLDNQET